MALPARLLRPTGSALHPDAFDWIRRVTNNGGSASTRTLGAMSQFCSAIDRAGLRDRFYRLNLFCGANLSAALVPLYRAPSLSDAPTGNTIDENNGPFVSGDYVEIGSNGGLNPGSTNSTKYLNTGLKPDDLDTLATGHLSAWNALVNGGVGFGGGVFRSIISVFGASTSTQIYGLQAGSGDTMYGYWGISSANPSSNQPPIEDRHLVITRTSSTNSRLYRDGIEAGALLSSATPGAIAQPWYGFANNNNGTTQRYWQGILRSYSIGKSLTASQSLSFWSAIKSFMQALGRA